MDELGDYESFAYDKDDPVAPRFFTSKYGTFLIVFFVHHHIMYKNLHVLLLSFSCTAEDAPFGALIRYTPAEAAYSDCWPEELPACNPYDILSFHEDPSKRGTHDYLVLSGSSTPATSGTFTWTSNRSTGESNANEVFPNSEGIFVRNRILDFVSKSRRRLYTLDLAAMTWESFDLTNPFFSINQPNQLAMMFGNDDYLFFCEDSIATQRSDIFGRYLGQGPDSGKFFTLVEATPTSALGALENTGLAFSPGNEHMIVTYQNWGVYKFWRTDGKPFSATFADVVRLFVCIVTTNIHFTYSNPSL